jgi:hypothetical protein
MRLLETSVVSSQDSILEALGGSLLVDHSIFPAAQDSIF